MLPRGVAGAEPPLGPCRDGVQVLLHSRSSMRSVLTMTRTPLWVPNADGTKSAAAMYACAAGAPEANRFFPAVSAAHRDADAPF